MIKVIAFDLDDTLWAVKPVILRAEERLNDWLQANAPTLQYSVVAMREFRGELIRQEPALAGQITELRRRIIEMALLRSGIAAGPALTLADQAIEVFLTARNDIQLFDGVLPALEHLSRQFTLGALSNGNADIQRTGLAAHFSFAFSAETVGAPKPAPALFHAALAHTRAQPHEMLYVGDDLLLDIDAANQVGLRTAWVKNPNRQEPGLSSPDLVIEQISELPGAVERLIAAG